MRLQFLKIIMERKLIPVVIHSGMAVEVIEKIDSKGRSACTLPDFCNRLASAAQARVKRRTGEIPPKFKPQHDTLGIFSDVAVLVGPPRADRRLWRVS